MIKIDIINKSGLPIQEEGIKTFLQNAYLARYPKQTVFIEIVAVSLVEIAELNKIYLQRTGPTDVLSFPNANPDNDTRISLGSIVFCPEYSTNHNETELEIIEHGFMHLIGFDHEADQAAWDTNLKILRHDISKL